MARPATPDVRITEGLQPGAQPLGLYDRPAQPAPSNLHGVAEALSGLSSSLTAVGEKNAAEQKANDAIQGEADFWFSNKDGAAEGVRSGEIPANKSPAYTTAYKRAMGGAAGFQLDTALEADYEKNGPATTDDPKAFDTWFRGAVSGKVDTKDPAVLKGLLPHLKTVQQKLHTRWQADVTKNTEYAAESGYSALASTTIDAYQKEGLASGSTNIDTLGASLDEIRAKGFEAGLRKEQIDRILTDAITTRALVHRDEGLLKLLDRESAGGPKLKDTPYGRDQAMKTEASLKTLWKTEATEERVKQEREDKLNANKAKADIVEQILKDPNAPLDERLIGTVQKVDGNFKLDLIKWRGTVRDNQVTDDPRKVGQLYTDILSGGDGMEKLMTAIRSGDVQSKENIAQGLTFVKAVSEYGQKPAGVLETAAASSYLKQLQTLGMDSKFSENRILGDAPVLTEGGRLALNNYRLGLMQWQAQNPNASPMEKEQFATQLGETLIKSFKPPEGGVGDRVFAPPASAVPQGAQQPAPAKAPTAAPAQGQPQNGQPQPQPQQQGMTFTAEEEAKIAAKALELKTTPEAVKAAIQRKAQQPQGQAPAGPGGAAVGPRSEIPSIKLPGGLGELHLAGLSGENADLVRQAVANLNLRRAQPQGEVNVDNRRVQSIMASPVGSLVQKVATKEGFDPNELAAMVSIESSGRPDASTGSYHGLLQLSDHEFTKYGDGGTDIFHPEENLTAGVRSLKDKSAKFSKEFGRKPSTTELYLMHQQGEAGLRAHEKNLDAPAWENMASTGEGKSKGDRWAKLAIWGNVPKDMRGRFGSVDNISSREFLAVWTAKLLGVSYDQALAMNTGRSPAPDARG